MVDEGVMGESGSGRILLIVVVLVIGLVMLWNTADGVFVYSITVDEAVARGAGPARYRVEGVLREGSIKFREVPCEWLFVLDGHESSLDVRYMSCVVPDTFGDDRVVDVVVQGRMREWGFEADEVIVRCPTKYEMREGDTCAAR